VKKLIVAAVVVSALAIVVILLLLLSGSSSEESLNTTILAQPIPSDSDYFLLTGEDRFYQNPAFEAGYSNALDHLGTPQNPFLAPNDRSNMHADSYMTDAYEVSGPLGVNPQVSSTHRGLAQCATVVFDSSGRILTTCIDYEGPKLLLLDPDTLDELASYTLPPRREGWDSDPIDVFHDTSGGAYFCLDDQDRAIVGTYAQSVQIVEYVEDSGFVKRGDYDLSCRVVPDMPGTGDKVGAVLPDWEGLLWFVTRYGGGGNAGPHRRNTGRDQHCGIGGRGDSELLHRR
jgi:hypothetical protein